MSAWLRCLTPRPMARQRLICFPWAGGGPSAFREWSAALPAEIEVWGVCLPAHEGRIAEAPMTDLLAASVEICNALEAMRTLPISLVGHSLGAWLAFEVARRMEQRGSPVRHLIVSGRRAPAIPHEMEQLSGLDDQQLLDRVRHLYGGIPDELWKQPEILEAVLPAFRGDLTMLENYRYERGPKLTSRIVAMGGESDPHTSSPGWLDGWCAETSNSCQVARFPGGHFFIQSASAEVLRTVRAELGPAPAPGP